MVLDQLLVKMPHVEVEVLLAIQLQHLLDRLHRHPLWARPLFATVEQTVVPKLLVALAPAPQAAIAYPDDLGRLPPFQAARHRLQNHFLNLHGPFRFRGGQQFAGGLHLPACPVAVSDRTDHVLIQADTSNANNI